MIKKKKKTETRPQAMKLKLTGTMAPDNSKDNKVSQRLDRIQDALRSSVECQGSQLKSDQEHHNQDT